MIASSAVFPTRRTPPDGFIIVAVLWILGALATLVSIYAVYVVDTAGIFGAFDDRLRAEQLVSAALELTAYRLRADPRPSYGRFEFRLSQGNVATEFRSETARIDLNAAPKDLVIGLLAELGVPRGEAEYDTDRIIGWRTPPGKGEDSEAFAYQKAGLRYAPRGAPFPHVNELSLVLDLPIALIERLLPFVTVYSGRPQLNILAAKPELIAALPGMTRDRLRAFLVQREVAPGNRQALMQWLGPSQRFATIDAGNASRVTVRVAFDNGRRITSEAVILVLAEDSEPFSILSWGDELEEPRGQRTGGAR